MVSGSFYNQHQLVLFLQERAARHRSLLLNQQHQQDGTRSISGQESLPAWTEPKIEGNLFVNRRHSRTFCNPGQRRRLFSLLQDLHSAGSTQSNQFPIRIRGYHYPKVPSGTLSKLLLFSLVKSRRSKIWLKFYDLHQVHSIKIAKSLLYSWLTWSRRSKIG